MMRTVIVLWAAALLAGCPKAKREEGAKAPDAGTQASAAPDGATVAAADAGVAASPVAAAKDFADRMCACKDVACGGAVLAEASQRMPEIMNTATDEDKAQVGPLRDQTFACMDKIVEGFVTGFADRVCACTDQACADKTVAETKPDWEAAWSSGGKSDTTALMQAGMKARECLGKIGYKGSTVPNLAATLDTMVTKACACQDLDCSMEATREGAREFAVAFTPDDWALVLEAQTKLEECVAKLRAAQPATKPTTRDALQAMVEAACKCPDQACVDKAIADAAKSMPNELTAEDVQLMTEAAKRAAECVAKMK